LGRCCGMRQRLRGLRSRLQRACCRRNWMIWCFGRGIRQRKLRAVFPRLKAQLQLTEAACGGNRNEVYWRHDGTDTGSAMVDGAAGARRDGPGHPGAGVGAGLVLSAGWRAESGGEVSEEEEGQEWGGARRGGLVKQEADRRAELARQAQPIRAPLGW
jgi:hypothetical protein